MKPLTGHLKLRETTVNLYAANKIFQMLLKAVKPYCTSRRGWKKETIPGQFKAGDERHLPGSDHRGFFSQSTVDQKSLCSERASGKLILPALTAAVGLLPYQPGFHCRSAPAPGVYHQQLCWHGITHGSKATGWPLPS